MSAARKFAPPPILPRNTSWTVEKIGLLSGPEIKQLRANAERLLEPEVAALCTQVLKSRPRSAAKPAVARKAVKPAVKAPPAAGS